MLDLPSGDPSNPLNCVLAFAYPSMIVAPVAHFADIFTNGVLETAGTAMGGSGREAMIQEAFAAAQPAPDISAGFDIGGGIGFGLASLF